MSHSDPIPAVNETSRDPTPLRRFFGKSPFGVIGAFAGMTMLASTFVSMCGPGCCFVFFSILAGFSGLMMLCKAPFTRCLSLCVLFLSIGGMWHEKEARDTWREKMQEARIRRLTDELNSPRPETTNPAGATSGVGKGS